MSKLIDAVNKSLKVNARLCKLSDTIDDPKDLVPKEVGDLATIYLASDDPLLRVLAVVIISIFFEGKPTFLMSKRSLDKLLADCSYIKRNTIGKDWSRFCEKYLCRVCSRIRDYIKGQRIPAVFTLDQKELLLLFQQKVGLDLVELQKAKVLNWYEEQKKNRKPQKTESSHERFQERDREIDRETKLSLFNDGSESYQLAISDYSNLASPEDPAEMIKDFDATGENHEKI